jgi:hypothetical protein
MIYNDIMNTEIGGDIISHSFIHFPSLHLYYWSYIYYTYIISYIYTQYNEAA